MTPQCSRPRCDRDQPVPARALPVLPRAELSRLRRAGKGVGALSGPGRARILAGGGVHQPLLRRQIEGAAWPSRTGGHRRLPSRRGRVCRRGPRRCTGRAGSAVKRSATRRDISSQSAGWRSPCRHRTALFVEPWIYETGLLDEFAVNAYWSGRNRDCLDASLKILATGKALGGETRDGCSQMHGSQAINCRETRTWDRSAPTTSSGSTPWPRRARSALA